MTRASKTKRLPKAVHRGSVVPNGSVNPHYDLFWLNDGRLVVSYTAICTVPQRKLIDRCFAASKPFPFLSDRGGELTGIESGEFVEALFGIIEKQKGPSPKGCSPAGWVIALIKRPESARAVDRMIATCAPADEPFYRFLLGRRV